MAHAVWPLVERRFPLVMQNIHRYFLYLGLFFICILLVDAFRSYWFEGSTPAGSGFGIGIGSLVLTANVVLLAAYTFSCHSLRHLIGGGRDNLSSSAARWTCYSCVSSLNR